jgi:alkylhydroperoxidase family enzyme
MEYETSDRYSEPERLALKYAERITLSDQDVDDDLFARLQECYSPEEIVELTCTVAFENFLSKFHHALLVESQGFCPVLPQPAP